MYLTTDAMLRSEADILVKRAENYLAQKQLDKAIGCLDKAIKKIKRAEMLKLSPLEEVIFGPIMKALSEAVAKNIMEGKL